MSASSDPAVTEPQVSFWERVQSHQTKITLLLIGLTFGIAAPVIGEIVLSLIGWGLAAFAFGQLWSYWGTHEFEDSNGGDSA